MFYGVTITLMGLLIVVVWLVPKSWPLVGPIIGILAVVVAIKFFYDQSKILVQCDWCGKTIWCYRGEYYRNRRRGWSMYCSGRCRRAEESSRGVKEKRYRIIEHE